MGLHTIQFDIILNLPKGQVGSKVQTLHYK